MAMMASNAELDGPSAADGCDEEGVTVRSVKDVEVRRSVADGVAVVVDVDDWICDAAYSLLDRIVISQARSGSRTSMVLEL